MNLENSQEQITEDEASLYDRQIRLWGLEAQNRMRSSTVLVISLRSLAHETIKNLVLAGIGRLIIADSGVVTEEDLGSGFLFREEDGAVGKSRTEAALPQIASLNPLVTLLGIEDDIFRTDKEEEAVNMMKREGVDVVVVCDLSVKENEKINNAARKAGSLFYAASSFGFYGYVFADLGESFEYVDNTPPGLTKKSLSYSPLVKVLDKANWDKPNGSPFRGLSKNATKALAPNVVLCLLALWEFESQNNRSPNEADLSDVTSFAENLRKTLAINPVAFPSVDLSTLSHLVLHSTHFFVPTLAILGGFLAQDVLRSLSRKGKPIANLLTVDSMGGIGTVGRWCMADSADA
nr:SUMO activating enzyme [Cryptococcus depauperatus CBS 7855]